MEKAIQESEESNKNRSETHLQSKQQNDSWTSHKITQ